MDENPETVNKMQKVIIGFNKLLNSQNICGVYGWFINNQPIYYGESTDILTRSYNHIMHIIENKEYWYNVIDYLDKNNLEIRILEKVNKNNYSNLSENDFKYNILKERELYYINRDKPDAQKCDGTDHIKSLEDREFKINY